MTVPPRSALGLIVRGRALAPCRIE